MIVWPGPWMRFPLQLAHLRAPPSPQADHHLSASQFSYLLLHTFDPSYTAMASAVMAAQTVVVAGLGSSMLRTSRTEALRGSFKVTRSSGRQVASPIRAAKLPQGVGSPKDEPKLPVSFWGFTENAEVWNSRAAMIGIFGILILEAFIHKGLLQAIGIDVGNGLDLPL